MIAEGRQAMGGNRADEVRRRSTHVTGKLTSARLKA